MRWLSISLCLLLSQLCSLHAEENYRLNTDAPPLEMTRQKLQLVKVLLEKSPALDRAAKSEDETLKRQVTNAQRLYDQASIALDAKETVLANKLLDEALQSIENAARRAPDPLLINSELQSRYNKLLEDTQNLLTTYHDLHERFPHKTAISMPQRVPRMIEQSRSLALENQYPKAIELLQNAHEVALAALNELLKSETLTYELKFESQAEEFDYELARYQSYVELIPVAYAELKPEEASIKLSERYIEESRALKEHSKQQADRGELKSATDTMIEAIKHLQSALRIVGLALPE